jgi:uncharacterized protein (DUF58 family)|tara:strand:+ start:3015 stop:3218 length:204 start_codon:yes stop_codon:yes gene_type:complete
VVSVLKGIGYLIAAIAILTVLASGGILFLAVGVAIGLLFSLTSIVLFTASGLRAFFEGDFSKSKSKD